MHLPGRSTTYRAFFVGLCRNVGKPTINIGCRDPPSTLSFSKIQTGGKRKWQIAILIILILGPMLMYGKVSQENYVELTAASAIPNKEIKSPQILRY